MLKTVLNQTELLANGYIQARFLKLKDGMPLEVNPYHRTVFAPDTDIDEQMAVVNEHLVLMGCAPVADADADEGIEKIRLLANVVRTPNVLAAHAERKAALIAEEQTLLAEAKQAAAGRTTALESARRLRAEQIVDLERRAERGENVTISLIELFKGLA